MSDNTDKSVEDGNVTPQENDNSTDAGIVDASNNNQNDKADEKKYSDKDYNDFVKRKSAELEARIKQKHDKSLEGKHVFTDDDLAKLRTDIENEVKTRLAMETKRAEYKNRGLTDVQLDTVQVEDIKDYDKRVDELFGAILKKEAPILNGGTKDKDSDHSENASINAWLQQDLAKTRYRR